MKKKPVQKPLLLFDIDGTLLLSNHHGMRYRFAYAIEKVYGVKKDGDYGVTEGAIDKMIFTEMAKENGVDEEKISEHLPHLYEAAFEYFVTNATEKYAKSILPGALELLTSLADNAHLGVLTGNYEKIGWKKLELVGLREFFEFGLFGHEANDRIELAKLVATRAKTHFGKKFHPRHIIFIGDTPRDIECAKAIGAKVVAVATGKYTVEDLQKYEPDLAVSSLTDPKVLPFLLGKKKNKLLSSLT